MDWSDFLSNFMLWLSIGTLLYQLYQRYAKPKHLLRQIRQRYPVLAGSAASYHVTFFSHYDLIQTGAAVILNQHTG